MKSAHETLGVSKDANEAEIRSRYLQLVREFPPDRAPERFAEIRAAFDELRNPIVQIERKLFSMSSGNTLNDLQAELRSRLKTAKLSVAALLTLADAP